MAIAAAAIPYIMMAGAAVAAYGAIRQGQIAKATGEYNATLNSQNAKLAEQEADMLAKQQHRENYLRMGALRAAQGKSGGAAGEGSVLDIIGDVAAQGELENQMIQYRGELKARGYTNTAALDRFSGEQAQRSSYLQAGSALLSGAGSAYGAGQRTTMMTRA